MPIPSVPESLVTEKIRPQHATFRFTNCDLVDHELRLGYLLTGGPDADIAFEEIILLPAGLPAPDPRDPVVRELMDGCHRIFGVSYFKAALPKNLEADPVDDADADFWDLVYTEGLGEFYYRNGLSPKDKARFPRGGVTQRNEGRVCGENTLILLGGGKDSSLVAEIVLTFGVPAVALAMGTSPWMNRSAEAAGLKLHTITRKLDENLFELNTKGAWNGHIPISACIAFISTLVAYAGGFGNVIAGNERGAEDFEIEVDGIPINHQWSKTFRFEQSFHKWCDRHFSHGPHYFSLLRPMSEIHIARLFAGLPHLFRSFTSCNRNFTQASSKPASGWCGRCSKCVFVYLLLAPHLTPAQLLTIFGGDLLADAENTDILQALLGAGDGKPWDCVGTTHECRLSLTALFRQQRLPVLAAEIIKNHPDVIIADDFAALWGHEMTLATPHLLTPEWQSRLDAYIRNFA